MRFLHILLLLTISSFAFGKSIPTDTTFSIFSQGTTSICSNDSVQLYAIGCSGSVNWSNGVTNSNYVFIKQSGDYFATCVPTNTVSNTYNVSVFQKPNPPIVSNNQNILTASGCDYDIIWSNGANGTSITVNSDGSYFASCKQVICLSNPSNIISLSIVPTLTISSDKTELCDLERANLTASGCTGTVFWNDGSTGNSIQITLPRTYSAYCQLPNGFNGLYSNEITITRIELPRPSIYSPNNIYCLSPTVTLASSSCPNGQIIWSTGATTNTITVSIAGTFTAQCQNQCGISQASNSVIVSSSGGNSVPLAPLIVSTKSFICNDETATLTAIGCNGTVVWNNTAAGTQIQIGGAGTYSAICQSQCGNSPSSNEIIIRKNLSPAAPVISSDKTLLCDGEKGTLTASGCSGNVLWITGATSTQIQVFSSGTYTAICQNICGDSPSSNPVIIRNGVSATTPTAVSNKSIICNGEAATLTASGCNGIVIWSNGMTPNSIQVTTGGTYTVMCQTICGNSLPSNEVIIKASITPPTPVISSPKTSICNGDIIILSSTSCFGNVVWSNSTSGLTTQVSKSGTYYAYCDNVCGTSSNSNAIIINELINQCIPIKVLKFKQ